MIFQSWLESVLDPKQRRSKSQKRLTRLFKLPKTAREEP
jgi:polar amino acid transport system permease protein